MQRGGDCQSSCGLTMLSSAPPPVALPRSSFSQAAARDPPPGAIDLTDEFDPPLLNSHSAPELLRGTAASPCPNGPSLQRNQATGHASSLLFQPSVCNPISGGKRSRSTTQWSDASERCLASPSASATVVPPEAALRPEHQPPSVPLSAPPKAPRGTKAADASQDARTGTTGYRH